MQGVAGPHNPLVPGSNPRGEIGVPPARAVASSPYRVMAHILAKVNDEWESKQAERNPTYGLGGMKRWCSGSRAPNFNALMTTTDWLLKRTLTERNSPGH